MSKLVIGATLSLILCLICYIFFIWGSSIGFDSGLNMGLLLVSNVVTPAPLGIVEEKIKCESELLNYENLTFKCIDKYNNISLNLALCTNELNDYRMGVK